MLMVKIMLTEREIKVIKLGEKMFRSALEHLESKGYKLVKDKSEILRDIVTYLCVDNVDNLFYIVAFDKECKEDYNLGVATFIQLIVEVNEILKLIGRIEVRWKIDRAIKERVYKVAINYSNEVRFMYEHLLYVGE